MTDLSVTGRIALNIFVVAFFVGGIVLAGIAHSWLPEYMKVGLLSWLILLTLFLIGVTFGGLLAYVLIIFFLAWLVPNSPLLIQTELPNPTLSQRMLLSVFHVVGKFARWLAPKPHR